MYRVIFIGVLEIGRKNFVSKKSDVRHPRCVSYNGKGLRMEYAQSYTTIF